MRIYTSKFCAIALASATLLLGSSNQVRAINLTNLDPLNAQFIGDEDSLSTAAGGPGNNGLLIPVEDTVTANGFTFNITFTPDSADLSGTVLLQEIGGTTNGVGLFLINGVPTLSLKTGAAGTPPASDFISDLDFSDGAATIFSSYGLLTAGNEISVAATWGLNNQYSLAVQDADAMFSTLDSPTITGQSDTDYNWRGNRTYNIADDLQPNPGSRGGLTDGVPASPFDNEALTNLTADLAPDSAIYWNDRAELSIDFGPPPPPPVPTLIINRDTGNITLENMSTSPVDLIAYTIQTTGGAFDTSEWNKVDDLDVNDDWEQLTASENPSKDLSEGTLGAGYTIDASGGANDAVDFGDAWIKSPFEDITFDFRNAAGDSIVANLEFQGNGGEAFQLGDFDFANGVDVGDWAILRSNLISDPTEEGLLAYALGDINIDGLVNELDFDQFKVAFDLANGPGAFAAMLSGAPEPSSVVLLALVGAAVAGVRKRRMLGALALVLMLGALTPSAQAVNLFSDSFDRATTPQVDDIDATSTGMSGTASPMVYVENGDAIVAMEPLTNIENNMLHMADGPNATAMYLDHNFVEASILSDGVLSISLDLISNDGGAVDNNRYVGFGIGATQAEFAGQTQLDQGASVAEPALRGTPNGAANGFGDFYIGWSPLGGGTVQVFKNGILVQTLDDGVENDGNQPGPMGATSTKLELQIAPGSFTAGNNVAATILYNGVAIGGDAFRWDNTGENYIGINARQDGAGFTVDNLAITTSTTPLEVQTLSLEVDTGTGEVFLVGGAGAAATIDRYTISSNGNLLAGGFNGIGGDAGLPVGTDEDPSGWQLGGVQTDSLLSEFFLGADGQGSSTLGGSFRASLGVIFDTGASLEDLSLEYRLVDGTLISGAATVAVPPGDLLGDFNQDGRVDAIDYAVWRENLGSGSALPNDNNLGVPVGTAHFNLWKSNYGATSPGAISTPEPAALLLVASLLGLLGGQFRRRHPLVTSP